MERSKSLRFLAIIGTVEELKTIEEPSKVGLKLLLNMDMRH